MSCNTFVLENIPSNKQRKKSLKSFNTVLINGLFAKETEMNIQVFINDFLTDNVESLINTKEGIAQILQHCTHKRIIY